MPLPDRPADLPADLHPIWAATIRQLEQAGTERVDPAALAAYCSAVHSNRTATRLITDTGPLIERDGHVVANPALAIQKDTAQVIRNLGRAMGLTRISAGQSAVQPAAPMQSEDPDGGGRWCAEHVRWECTHNRSRGRGTCHGPRKRGTAGCRMHAGSNQDVKHAAATLVRPLAAGQLRDVSPGQALLEEVARTAQEVEWLATQVGQLQGDAVVWGRDRERVSSAGEWPGTEVLSTAKPHVWVQLYHQQRRHLAAVCAAALAANVDERMVRVAEAQGAAIVQLLQAVFADPQLGLTPAQRAVLPQVVPRHLRAIAS